jgi:hypothetical protein
MLPSRSWLVLPVALLAVSATIPLGATTSNPATSVTSALAPKTFGPLAFTCGPYQCYWELEVDCTTNPETGACYCSLRLDVDCSPFASSQLATRRCNSSGGISTTLCGTKVTPKTGKTWATVSTLIDLDLTHNP